jgi:hypothetical protein
MRKSVPTMLIALLATIFGYSQTAYEGKIEYQKKDEPALIIDFPYPPNIVEFAIIDRMEHMGHKKKESKGFLIYKNVVIKEISNQPMDYMIKVERKSRKEKDESEVYFIMNNTEENVLARTHDPSASGKAKTFLSELHPHIQKHHLEMLIKDQEELVEKAEKKLKGLQDDKEDMDKKVKKLNADLEENGKDQQDQQKEIEKQKQALDALKSRRKG